MIGPKIRQVQLLLLLIVAGLLTVRCAPTATQPAAEDPVEDQEVVVEELHFAFANASESFDLFKQLGDAMERDASTLGITLSRYNNDLDGPTALDVARLMVQEQPDVILEWNQVEGVGGSLAQVFHEAGIPCISVNIPVPGCPWFNISNRRLGIDGANAIVEIAQEKGWTADNTVVLIGQAATSGWEVNDSPRYFYVTVAEQMGMDMVDPSQIGPQTTTIGNHGIQYDCQNQVEASYNAVKNLLPSIPPDKNILSWAPNDDCSFGAWRAIEEAGRGDQTLTGGPIGSPHGLEQLRTNPSWVVQGSVFIDQWPKYVLPMAVAQQMGLELPPLTIAPQVIFTKDTVDDYFDADNNPIRLPPLAPENEYLLETGLLEKFTDIDIPGVPQSGLDNDS